MFVVVSPIRKSVANTHSQPPPNVWPFNTERVGNGRSSSLLKIELANFSHWSSSSSGFSNKPKNSVMSAPTIKASLSEVKISPLIFFRKASSLSALSRASSVAISSLLTDPDEQKLSSATPLSNSLIERVLA